MFDPQQIKNARALLREFERSKLKSCHIVTRDLDIFLSRDPATRARDVHTNLSTSVAAETAAAAGVATDMLAPHVGTLIQLSPLGTAVAKGDVLGQIAVLDDTIELRAEAQGIVSVHHRQLGELVEYGQKIATVTA